MNKVEQYIENGWNSCIRHNTDDDGTLIGMPYPYTVPCFVREDKSGDDEYRVEYFNEMYYWDTYFTNVGLILTGKTKLARNNVDNLIFLVNKYGFMPNGNRTFFLDRSQPPFLSAMVRDVYEAYRDKEWLRGAYTALEKEYDFWMTKRISDIGLNHYGHNEFVLPEEEYAQWYIERLGYIPDEPVEKMASHFMGTAESGWDVSPRFGGEIFDYAPADLNSLMYMLEDNMAFFASELDIGDDAVWVERAMIRKERIFKYLDNGEGLLLDYNFVDGHHSAVLSAATFYPMFAGIADESHAKALAANLYRLETPYGVLSCEKTDIRGSFQWGYPNGWPCLQYIAIVALDKYGYREEARRIAGNYVSLVEKVFDETGNLWEKYNMAEGNINVTNEYEMPAMMGWSAGVYLAAKKYVDGTV